MASLADALPNRIGSMIFCAACGTLLEVTEQNEMPCPMCGTVDDARKYDGIPVHYRSRDIAFPSPLRNKRHVADKAPDKEPKDEATIRETCPKCGYHEASFYSLQLRSADEGATIFYTCLNPKGCAHKWSTNN